MNALSKYPLSLWTLFKKKKKTMLVQPAPTSHSIPKTALWALCPPDMCTVLLCLANYNGFLFENESFSLQSLY